MKSLRYLNMILTVVAVLLTLNLWTQWTSSAGPLALDGAATAHAAEEGLGNPAAQRNEHQRLGGGVAGEHIRERRAHRAADVGDRGRQSRACAHPVTLFQQT